MQKLTKSFGVDDWEKWMLARTKNGGHVMPKKHKHHDAIVAWAAGARIEHRVNPDTQWREVTSPIWLPYQEYRIKPKEERLFVRVARHNDGSLIAYSAPELESPHLADDRWAITETMRWVNDDILQVHGER